MSIFKSVTNTLAGNVIETLPDKIAYLIDPLKTQPDTIWALLGNTKDLASVSMFHNAVMFNQQKYGQKGRKAYDHFIIRFSDEEDFHNSVNLDDIVSAVKDLADLFSYNIKGHPMYEIYFCLASIHYDSQVPHAHFLLDTIDFRNGKRRILGPADFDVLRSIVSNILTSHKISPIRMKKTVIDI